MDMSIITDFESALPDRLQKEFKKLDSPFAVQEYIDTLPYIAEERDHVMLDGQCHCLDGGLLVIHDRLMFRVIPT